MRSFRFVALALLLVAVVAVGCASSGIGKAIQGADAQKQLVERAAVEFIKLKLKKDPRITDAVYASGREAYEKWKVSEEGLAQALSSWKTVKSAENESTLNKVLAEVTAHADTYLALVGKFVDLTKLKDLIKSEAPGAPTPLRAWAELEHRIYARGVVYGYAYLTY